MAESSVADTDPSAVPIGVLDTFTYTFSFNLASTPNSGIQVLRYKKFSVSFPGRHSRRKHLIDPKYLNCSNEVVVDVLSKVKENEFPVKSETRYSYIYCDIENKGREILSIDRIWVEVKQKNKSRAKSGSKGFDPYEGRKAIVPARYEKFKGFGPNGRGKKLLLGDFFHSLIELSARTERSSTKPDFTEIMSSRKEHWWHRSGLAKVSYTIDLVKDDDGVKVKEYVFNGTVILRRYVLGEIAAAAPFPCLPDAEEEHDKFKNSEHSIVLATISLRQNSTHFDLSQAAWENLKVLTRHLQFRDCQITWIKGDPGSGKEGFTSAIHHGCVSSYKHMMETRSAAGSDFAELNRRLFTAEEGEPCLIEKAEYFSANNEMFELPPNWRTAANSASKSKSRKGKKKKEPEEWEIPFLQIDDKPFGGTVFLDEFDKVDEKEAKKIYGSMLRVLEAKEYIKKIETTSNLTGQGTGEKELPKKYNKLNWIFAGAFSQADPAEIVPPDFWSRLTGYISLQNPLREKSEYAETLFILFYVQEALELLGTNPGERLDRFAKFLRKGRDGMDFAEVMFNKVIGREDEESFDRAENAPFRHPKKLLDAAGQFAQHVVVSPGVVSDKVDSARAIRQAARIVCHEMRSKIIDNADNTGAGEAQEFEHYMRKAMDLARRSLMLSRGQ